MIFTGLKHIKHMLRSVYPSLDADKNNASVFSIFLSQIIYSNKKKTMVRLQKPRQIFMVKLTTN